MALSRMAALLVLAAPVPALAEPVTTAESAMERYRETFTPVSKIGCAQGEADEIVVCARRQRSQRVELLERQQLAALAPGEAGSGMDALDAGGCLRLCHQPLSIDLLAIPGFIGKVIERLKDE